MLVPDDEAGHCDYWLMSADSAIQPGHSKPTAATRLLRAEAIFKAYRMGRSSLEVLRNCALHVDAGEFVAIMGKSGSGKSTLLHILGALDVPQKGQVYFNGADVFAPPAERRLTTGITDVFSDAERYRNNLRRRQFGFVFQYDSREAFQQFTKRL